MNHKKWLLALLPLLGMMTGCLKEDSCQTKLVFKPLVQATSVETPVAMREGLKAFTYAVDTADWHVASYEEAVQGVITNKETQEKLAEPKAVGVPYDGPGAEEEARLGWIQMPLPRTQMVVVVDTLHCLYGYTMQESAVNLPYLYVSMVMMPWKEGKSYQSGKWLFFNDFYQPKVDLKVTVRPQIQDEEGAEAHAPSSQSLMKVYAYRVDTADWYIRSYDDAYAGRITRKTDSTEMRDRPNFTAYPDADGQYSMTVNDSPLMVVVVDRTNRQYAYSKQEPVLEGESPLWQLVFQAWTKEWIRQADGWTFIDEEQKPKPEKPEPEPEPGPDPGPGPETSSETPLR